MREIKAAVSGLGRIGWNYHLPALNANNGFKLVAAYDPVPGRLEEAKSKYGVRGYSHYGELLDSGELDLVVIASPTQAVGI